MSELHWQIQQARHKPNPTDPERCVCGAEWRCVYREQADRVLDGKPPLPGKVLTLV